MANVISKFQQKRQNSRNFWMTRRWACQEIASYQEQEGHPELLGDQHREETRNRF